MRFVLDTNILIAALVRKSTTRKLLLLPMFEFYIPEYALDEVKKHIPLIVKKSGLSNHELQVLLNLLVENITIVPAENIKPYLNKAMEIIGHIDENDVPFVALALSLPNEGIWTNDTHFNQQKFIKIWTTEALLKAISSKKKLQNEKLY